MIAVPLPPADPDAIHEWGLGVMKEFGLSGWSLSFNRRVSSYGLCRYFRRRIELSIHLVRSGLLSEIRETLLHEIAHALVGRGHGHGPVWKAKAIEVGAKPLACGDAVMPVPPGRWVAACPGCSA